MSKNFLFGKRPKLTDLKCSTNTKQNKPREIHAKAYNQATEN